MFERRLCLRKLWGDVRKGGVPPFGEVGAGVVTQVAD